MDSFTKQKQAYGYQTDIMVEVVGKLEFGISQYNHYI